MENNNKLPPNNIDGGLLSSSSDNASNNNTDVKSQIDGLNSIVAITACAAGVAHTYMAADQLKKEAKKLGIKIHIETQGTIGAENVIPEADLQAADLVIIASDVKVDVSRFNNKKVFISGVNPAIKDPRKLINDAWKNGTIQGKKGTKLGAMTFGATKKKGIINHLMTGLSWMIPLTIASGITMAIANLCAFQYEYNDSLGNYNQDWVLGTRKIPSFLMSVGGLGFKLMIPLLSAFIAYSVADRPGVAPGLVAGWIVNDNSMLDVHVVVAPNSVIEPGAGFIGAIIVGLLSGYFVAILKIIKWPKILQPIVPLMIIPIIAVICLSLFIRFVIGPPIANMVMELFNDLAKLQSQYAGVSIVIALVLGIMISFDLGGPINKTAMIYAAVVFYQTLAVALSQGKTYWDADFVPMTATQAAISVPPLGMWLSTVIFKHKYVKTQRIMGKVCFGTGIVGIGEGTIPLAVADPFRVIPANIIGGGVTAILVTVFNCKFAAGLGSPIGTFLGYIKQDNAPYWPMAWIISIVIGILITAFIAGITKRSIKGDELALLNEEKAARKAAWKKISYNTKICLTDPKQAKANIGPWTKRIYYKRINGIVDYWTWIGKNVAGYFIGIGKTWVRYGVETKRLAISTKNGFKSAALFFKEFPQKMRTIGKKSKSNDK